jgi:UDP:flavonoid glycosyltransferase YjiC (YdhE family)
MARFLFTVWSFDTHLNPFMLVGEALRGRGHAVSFYAGRRAEEALNNCRFPVFPFDALDEEKAHASVERYSACVPVR